MIRAGALSGIPIPVTNITGLGAGVATALGVAVGSAGSFTVNGGVGAFTTLSASSTITPSQTAGIVGTTTNNDANAGSIGEYISATQAPVGTFLTTATTANITSISLTAGDWDVSGVGIFRPTATTNIIQVIAGISTTSATVPIVAQLANFVSPTAGLVQANGADYQIVTPTVRISIAATTTVYLVAFGQFSVSTLSAYGFIRARRVR